MTMPASQPVDYIAFLRKMPTHYSSQTATLDLLIDQLTALREAVKMAQRHVDLDDLLTDLSVLWPDLFKAITALTHTTQGEET